MKSKENVVTHGLSGKFDLLVFSQRHGQTIVGKVPRHTTVVTAAQEQIRVTFKDAAIYAKAATADPAIKQAYKQKARPGQSAFNLAIADFFKPPTIGDIDTSNYTGAAAGKISIQVTDDFKVAAVKVKIQNANGNLVEEGSAVLQADGLHWVYTSTQANASVTGDVISITATDIPGHAALKQITL